MSKGVARLFRGTIFLRRMNKEREPTANCQNVLRELRTDYGLNADRRVLEGITAVSICSVC